MEYFKPGISLGRFWSRRSELVRVALNAMNSLLPPTGTAALLRELSPHVPDDFINQLLPRSRGRGRRRQFSPAQAQVDGTATGWLAVTPASGNTPATFAVAISITNLAAGTYTGRIVIT